MEFSIRDSNELQPAFSAAHRIPSLYPAPQHPNAEVAVAHLANWIFQAHPPILKSPPRAF